MTRARWRLQDRGRLMRISGFERHALSICVAAAILAGCGGSQPPTGAPGAVPQSTALATRADRGTSWMLPEAKSDDLLYVSNFKRSEVDYFSYPAAKLVGKLSSLHDISGLCSDAAGNVWVVTQTNTLGTLVEYAHGGNQPIATLSIPGQDPLGCTVDQSTGSLAVVHDVSDVSIYQNEQGSPQTYGDGDLGFVNSLTYDTNDDLFLYGSKLIGDSRLPVLGELPNGGTSFSNVTFHQRVLLKTFAQWYGKDILLSGITGITGRKDGRTETEKVWKVTVSQSGLKVAGVTSFDVVGKSGIGQSAWLQGTTLIQQDQTGGNEVYFFSFTAGGAPIKTIRNSPGGRWTSITISLAPK
jgi:hypothetical protein